MKRFKNSTVELIMFFMLLLYGLGTTKILAWENQKTHPEITEKAVERSVLNNFLNNQLGLNDGLETQLELTGQFQNNINMRVAQEPEFEWDNKTKVSILEWLRRGSSLEDVPNPRARHHFHDPIRNTGLNNLDADPEILSLLWLGSKWHYPDYWVFDTTGLSTLDRAKGLDGNWENEYLNYYNWVHARSLFYAALTWESKSERGKFLGSMFVTLGHICHLLEDMGVPAHARNDFLFGHYRSAYKFDWGNPLETWVGEQIEANGGQSPWSGNAPVVFDKLTKYFDTDTRDPNDYLGASSSPPDIWGLAESTNYQFLSKSTIFRKNDATKYYFPQPVWFCIL